MSFRRASALCHARVLLAPNRICFTRAEGAAPIDPSRQLADRLGRTIRRLDEDSVDEARCRFGGSALELVQTVDRQDHSISASFQAWRLTASLPSSSEPAVAEFICASP